MEIKMINGKKFELIKDNEGFILEEVENKLTDYYDNFDYIVGDWAYGKLRLKGFLAEENKKVKDYNNIKFVEEYRGNQIPEGKKSIMLRVTFDSGDTTLTSEEINTKLDAIIRTLNKMRGAVLREE